MGAPAIIDPSADTPAELPAVVLAQADALMVSMANTLTATIRQERDRARQERAAEREVHRAALESERAAGEARAKALQGQIDALSTLRAEMRDQLAEAAPSRRPSRRSSRRRTRNAGRWRSPSIGLRPA